MKHVVPLRAFLAYLALSIIMTWPLTLGLAADVPGDLGDPLLNMWIMGWGAEKAPLLLTGQISLRQFWNANIFHPEPLALAFSEHLFGQVLQILPIYWSTKNLILCYNLIFLSSFALSGLGMFLLVRALLTHDGSNWGPGSAGNTASNAVNSRLITSAAFVAGLIFAFVPYRIGQLSHIQSLCSQWMPFALYGFHRFIAIGRLRALAGGSAALLMQHWSNGYYMLYFAPIVPAFVLHQMWVAGRLRNLRIWAAFGTAALVIAAGTAPFLLMYLEARRVHGFTRDIGEIEAFSADVYSYFTAAETLNVWGDVMQALPKPEGELFFGLTPMVLAAVAVVALFWRGIDTGVQSAAGASAPSRLLRPVSWFLGLFAAIQLIGLAALLISGPNVIAIAGFEIRATDGARLLINLVVASAVLLSISPSVRIRAFALARSPLTVAALLCAFAIWMSFGPDVRSRERVLQFPAIYDLFFEYVPGFEGLRVPSRYAMVAAVFLSVTAGYGAALLARLTGRAAITATVMCVLFLIEVSAFPFPRNVTADDLPGHIATVAGAPAVYHVLERMPADTVVAEFPFGEIATDIRYTYYSTVHWKPLVNGYSGGFPNGFQRRVATLRRVDRDPDAAWRTLVEAGTTHVVVHAPLLGPDRADYIVKWLDDHFAVEIARFPEGDLLYDVTGTWPRR